MERKRLSTPVPPSVDLDAADWLVLLALLKLPPDCESNRLVAPPEVASEVSFRLGEVVDADRVRRSIESLASIGALKIVARWQWKDRLVVQIGRVRSVHCAPRKPKKPHLQKTRN